MRLETTSNPVKVVSATLVGSALNKLRMANASREYMVRVKTLEVRILPRLLYRGRETFANSCRHSLRWTAEKQRLEVRG
jgi:hypothetical protein